MCYDVTNYDSSLNWYLWKESRVAEHGGYSLYSRQQASCSPPYDR
jgi:hypothetical protein